MGTGAVERARRGDVLEEGGMQGGVDGCCVDYTIICICVGVQLSIQKGLGASLRMI